MPAPGRRSRGRSCRATSLRSVARENDPTSRELVDSNRIEVYRCTRRVLLTVEETNASVVDIRTLSRFRLTKKKKKKLPGGRLDISFVLFFSQQREKVSPGAGGIHSTNRKQLLMCII